MNKNHPFTLHQGLAPANSLTLVQHNSLGSWAVFLSLFSSFADGPPVDIVLLQDPPSSQGFLPNFCGFKSFSPSIAWPRVACYVSQHSLQKFAVLPFFPPETDHFIVLDVFTPRGCFGSDSPCFRIGNTYSRRHHPAPHSVSVESSLLDVEYPYLVAGDFNIHNPATDPFRLLCSKEEERESAPYFDRASDLGFTLLNTRGMYTPFPFTGTHRPSAIDRAFANPHIFPIFRSWDASTLASTGSDHTPILITFHPPSPYNDKPRPRWQDADWLNLSNKLKDWLVPPPPDTPSPNQLNQWFSSALNALTTTIEATATHSRPSPRSKPWWTPLLPPSVKNLQRPPGRPRNAKPPTPSSRQDNPNSATLKSLKRPSPRTGLISSPKPHQTTSGRPNN